MPMMNTDTAVLAKEAANFDRISSELVGIMRFVDATAENLRPQWTGAAGSQAQLAFIRFQEAAQKQVDELNDISGNIHTAGSHYTLTDDDQSSALTTAMHL